MGKLVFPKQDIELDVDDGTELVDVLDDAETEIEFSCYSGSCVTCCFRVLDGMENLSPRTQEEDEMLEEESSDLRLACQCTLLEGSVKVEGVEL